MLTGYCICGNWSEHGHTLCFTCETEWLKEARQRSETFYENHPNEG